MNTTDIISHWAVMQLKKRYFYYIHSLRAQKWRFTRFSASSFRHVMCRAVLGNYNIRIRRPRYHLKLTYLAKPYQGYA